MPAYGRVGTRATIPPLAREKFFGETQARAGREGKGVGEKEFPPRPSEARGEGEIFCGGLKNYFPRLFNDNSMYGSLILFFSLSPKFFNNSSNFLISSFVSARISINFPISPTSSIAISIPLNS